MIDPMKEARKGKWFKWYSFLAGIRIKMQVLSYKIKLKLFRTLHRNRIDIIHELIYSNFFKEIWKNEHLIK